MIQNIKESFHLDIGSLIYIGKNLSWHTYTSQTLFNNHIFILYKRPFEFPGTLLVIQLIFISNQHLLNIIKYFVFEILPKKRALLEL